MSISAPRRFPNGERHAEFVVLERLIASGEPHYQLRDSGGPGLYVLGERQLSPGGPAACLGAASLFACSRRVGPERQAVGGVSPRCASVHSLGRKRELVRTEGPLSTRRSCAAGDRSEEQGDCERS
jgi:hypothetical protein